MVRRGTVVSSMAGAKGRGHAPACTFRFTARTLADKGGRRRGQLSGRRRRMPPSVRLGSSREPWQTREDGGGDSCPDGGGGCPRRYVSVLRANFGGSGSAAAGMLIPEGRGRTA